MISAYPDKPMPKGIQLEAPFIGISIWARESYNSKIKAGLSAWCRDQSNTLKSFFRAERSSISFLLEEAGNKEAQDITQEESIPRVMPPIFAKQNK